MTDTTTTDGAHAPDGAGSPSFAERLFCGEIRDDMVFPFPRIEPGEQQIVDRLLDEFGSYCRDNYDPRSIEEQRWIPEHILEDLGAMGMMGLYVPEAHGGRGLSQSAYCRIFQSVGEVDATLAVVLGVHQSIGYKAIHLFGTDDQKDRFLPDLASGRALAAFALTEENAGSDAYHVETTARRQPDGSYIVNGDKRYIGNGSRADVLTTFARTEDGSHVALLVQPDMDGFEVGARHETLGLRGNDLRQLHFREMRVPAENLLGEEGDGFKIAMSVLNNGRMSLGAGSVGALRQLLDMAIDHAAGRHQFGRPLAEFQLVGHKLGQMATQLYGLESMGYLTTGLADRGAPDVSLESAMVKVVGTELLWYAANRVFQIAGGAAYLRDAPYEKILRDIRIFPIFEGANDVLRMFVGLKGCQAIGDELEGMRDLDLREPLESLGAVMGYVGGRVRRAVRPDGLPEAHPDFAGAADRVARQVTALRSSGEGLLRAHGQEITERQADLKRLTHASMEVYGQIATISRITGVLGDDSAGEPLGDEHDIATAFCDRAAHRADRWLAQIEDNDDDQIDRIADHLVDRGRYGHSAIDPTEGTR